MGLGCWYGILGFNSFYYVNKGFGELVIGVICSYFGLSGLVYVSYIFLDISYVYKKYVSIDASSNARHIFYIYLDVRNQD